MNDLSVGDRVRVVSSSSHLPVGSAGTVLEIDGSSIPYKVMFDRDPSRPVWVIGLDVEKVPASPTSGRELQVGDMVRIKSREWYESNKDLTGCIMCGGCGFVPGMAEYCGHSFVIDAVHGSAYKLRGAGGFYYTADIFDFSAPASVIAAKSLDARIQDAVKGVCGAFGKPTVEVRLIKANKLLTNIKVD